MLNWSQACTLDATHDDTLTYKAMICVGSCMKTSCLSSVSMCDAGQAMLTAAEVVISLHSVGATRDELPLCKIMACLDPCMKEDVRFTFPPEAMVVALQRLVTR